MSSLPLPLRFSPVPEIMTYFQKFVTLPEALVESEYDNQKMSEEVIPNVSLPLYMFFIN